MGLKVFTDYPFTCLGDQPCKPAPVREIEILAYDSDKYVIVQLPRGYRDEIKIGYCYTKPKRLDDIKKDEYVSLKMLKEAEVPILPDMQDFYEVMYEGRLKDKFFVFAGQHGKVGFETYCTSGATVEEALERAHVEKNGDTLLINHRQPVDWIQVVDVVEHEIVWRSDETQSN